MKIYSGEIDIRPQSSHFRYSTGSASERPTIFALGTPHRGHTMPEVERFAISLLLTPFGTWALDSGARAPAKGRATHLDSGIQEKDTGFRGRGARKLISEAAPPV